MKFRTIPRTQSTEIFNSYILSGHRLGEARNLYERFYEEESMSSITREDIYKMARAPAHARRRAQDTAHVPPPTNNFLLVH